MIEISNIGDVGQAALDAHIAALAERDAEGRMSAPEPGTLNSAPWLKPPAHFRLTAETDHAPHTAGTGLASITRRARRLAGLRSLRRSPSG